LLIGAGASVKSGVLLAADMAERAARWAYAKQLGRSWEDPRLLRSDWLPWMREQPWFDPGASIADNYPAAIENLLQPRQARADFFRKLLQTDVRPSPGYERLVEFMHQGFIKTVLTTNFDALLTETQVLVRRPHYINVIQTASDYTKFSTSPQYPQEVFLHGSVDHYTDKNIVDEVQRLDPDLVNMVVPLLRDHPLIVVGYRGTEASVMEHLLLENATLAHEFRHGIFWCKLKSEQDHDLSSRIQKLAQAIAKNFTVVDIDGFDELFARDLWQLHQDAEPVLPSKMTVVAAAAPTLDMEVVQVAGLDELDWPTVQARIVQYCGALQIPAPSSLDRKWIIDRLLQLNLALGQDGKDHHLTTAGCLLFSQKPQSVVPDARVVLRATGDAQWLERALGEKEPFGRNEPVAQVERVIEGSLMPTSFRLVRFGSYPPNRGTLCTVNEDRSYLFTTGYMPELKTYPGPHIPSPVQLAGDTPGDIDQVARDILGLARMNWNTASITGGMPVTLFFARRVGGIMAEFGAIDKDARPPTSFRYYM
jgi:hypothetical protein